VGRGGSSVWWDVPGGHGHDGSDVGRPGMRVSGGRVSGGRERASSGRGFGRVSVGRERARSERGFGRGSPYNHPPLRKASTRCLVRRRERTERDGTESSGSDATWGRGVVSVEFCDFFGGIADLVCILPGVAFCSVAFPFDQVLESPSVHSTVQDLFHCVLLFSVDEFWWRGGTYASAGDWVGRGGCQLYYIKDRVQTFHRGWQGEAVGIRSDSSFYRERT